jgi:hypothetical protein
VVPGERILVVVAERGGPFGEAFVRAHPAATLVKGVPVGVKGTGRVREWTVATPAGEQRLKADVLVVDAPRAPAYELCAQAGAVLVHEDAGFVVRAPGGRIRDGVFAVGEVLGTPLDPTAIAREAEAVADSVKA